MGGGLKVNGEGKITCSRCLLVILPNGAGEEKMARVLGVENWVSVWVFFKG